MTSTLIDRAEQHDYQKLFIQDLNWSKPDHAPIVIDYDGHPVEATNVSSYKGLRVWVVEEKPNSKLEAIIDRQLAKTSTDRIVIFHDDEEQVWRWPVRRVTEDTTATRLSRHRHQRGDADPRFANRLDVIRLPVDVTLDANTVLARVRSAFDVETQNETKHASKLMARLYAAMEKAYPPTTAHKARDHQISVTLARILFLMFGDDTDMWQKDLFRDFIHHYTKADGSDIGERLTELFAFLDTPPNERAGASPDLEGFHYVNGGIFSERIKLPAINSDFRTVVLDACHRDWATISPAIFGSMFQSVRDPKVRRELGEHYTSEANILKTLDPLFLDELRSELAKALERETIAKQINALNALWKRLGDLRFMDPACGCGNFIIVAYRELRGIELQVMESLLDRQHGADQLTLGGDLVRGLRVTLDHFAGIEIDEWPARIAATAMFLVDRQCDLRLRERFGEAPKRLPLTTEANIVVGNALRMDWASIIESSGNVVVAGNPPFLGHKERSKVQAEELRDAWDGSTVGHLDYVTAWYAKALDFFTDNAGKWAFVSTNSVSQGEGVPKLFGRIFDAGWRIRFAHRTFQWTSEASNAAGVQCVILGFDKSSGPASLYDYPDPKGRGIKHLVDHINAYLSDGPLVLVTPSRKPIADIPEIRAGSTPIDWDNLALREDDPDGLARLRADAIASKYLRPYVGGRELIHRIARWCLWLQPDSEALQRDIASSAELLRRVDRVRAKRLESKREATRKLADIAHSFGENRQPNHEYLAIPQTFSEHRPYVTASRLPPATIASVKLFTAEDADGLLFALISSSMFLTWQLTVGGKLESRPSFSSSVVWNTFPVPRLAEEDRASMIAAGRAIEAARALYPDATLAGLYERKGMPIELAGAHEGLDRIVDCVFGAEMDAPSHTTRQRILLERYRQLLHL